MDECGRSGQKQQVKQWYDGFIFGEHADIYNPWSILNFLDKGIYTTYWANTSSNSLAGKVIREGSCKINKYVDSIHFSYDSEQTFPPSGGSVYSIDKSIRFDD